MYEISQIVSETHPVHGITLLSLPKQFVVELRSACWSSSLVAGTEVERLRPALIQPKPVCSNCHGYEVLRYLTAAEVTPPTCTHCGGLGTVPTGAV